MAELIIDNTIEAIVLPNGEELTLSGGEPTLQSKSVSYTPTETAQSATVTPDSGYDGLDEVSVSVGAISNTYVGSGITQRSSSDLTASGATVTVPSGYYSAQATKSVASGVFSTAAWAANETDTTKTYRYVKSITTAGYFPTQNVGATLTLNKETAVITPTENEQTVQPSGDYKYLNLVTVNPIPSQYIIPSGTKSISANGTGIDVTQYAAVDVDVPSSAPTLQSKSVSITPSETAQSQTVTPDSGYDGLDEVSVSVGAISSTYVGTGITRRSSSNLTASGATVSVPSGYYASNASKAVASGTEGTPTATKGTVSNHAISVTPSVTNSAGYISGGTHTGTAVSVSASELVSGSETKTANGTYDVTNLASLVVAVPLQTIYTGTSAPSSSTGTDGDVYIQTA